MVKFNISLHIALKTLPLRMDGEGWVPVYGGLRSTRFGFENGWKPCFRMPTAASSWKPIHVLGEWSRGVRPRLCPANRYIIQNQPLHLHTSTLFDCLDPYGFLVQRCQKYVESQFLFQPPLQSRRLSRMALDVLWDFSCTATWGSCLGLTYLSMSEGRSVDEFIQKCLRSDKFATFMGEMMIIS